MMMWIPPFLHPKPAPAIKEMHRMAFICYGGLGDVLFFSPVIQVIKQWLPKVHITLYVEARSAGVGSVLEGVDNLLSMPVGELSKPKFFEYLVRDIRQRHFDGIISTGRNPFIALAIALGGVPYRVGYPPAKAWAADLLSRTALYKPDCYASEMHMELAHAFLKGVIGPGYEPLDVPALPHIKPPDDKIVEAMNALKQTRQPAHRKHILIHPGVSLVSQKKGIYKGWSANRWAEFILALSRDHAVYLIGGPDDVEIIQHITHQVPEGLANFKNLMGETKSFTQLAALMQVMDVICTVDSAPLHLSVGLGKPTLAFFGPTNDAVLVPKLPNLVVVTHQELSCRPCLWQVRERNCESSDCLDVPVELMLSSVRGLIRDIEASQAVV
jgi:putative inorganic carbon (hco3(-)) transporter